MYFPWITLSELYPCDNKARYELPAGYSLAIHTSLHLVTTINFEYACNLLVDIGHQIIFSGWWNYVSVYVLDMITAVGL